MPRAARVLDQLEQAGIVGPGSGLNAQHTVRDIEAFLTNLNSQS